VRGHPNNQGDLYRREKLVWIFSEYIYRFHHIPVGPLL